MRKLIIPTLLLVLSPLLVAGQGLHSAGEPTKYETTTLIDEFGRLGGCNLGARMDVFMLTLLKDPSLRGYVISYQDVNVPLGRIDRLVYEATFINHMQLRRFDPSRITFIRGGFRQDVHNEYWVVPSGGKLPEPSNSLPTPKIPKNAAFLYDNDHLYDEYAPALLSDLVLQSVLDKEQLELEEELEEGSDVENQIDDDVEIDSRTPEEIEETRFRWVSIMFGDHLTKNPKTSGVVIYYADDEYYDLGKFSEFIKTGVARITDTEKGSAGRIKIVFGGYRSTPEVEYWVVPQNGKLPEPTPEERTLESECEDQP